MFKLRNSSKLLRFHRQEFFLFIKKMETNKCLEGSGSFLSNFTRDNKNIYKRRYRCMAEKVIETYNIKMDELLKSLNNGYAFSNLEKILAFYFPMSSPSNYAKFIEHLNVSYGQQIGTDLFRYLIWDRDVSSIQDRTLKQNLAKLNAIKALYLPLIVGAQVAISAPFLLKSIVTSGNEKSFQTNMSFIRNDGESFSVEADLNNLFVYTMQTTEVMTTMMDYYSENIDLYKFDFDKLKNYLDTIFKFVDQLNKINDSHKADVPENVNE